MTDQMGILVLQVPLCASLSCMLSSAIVQPAYCVPAGQLELPHIKADGAKPVLAASSAPQTLQMPCDITASSGPIHMRAQLPKCSDACHILPAGHSLSRRVILRSGWTYHALLLSCCLEFFRGLQQRGDAGHEGQLPS